MTINQSRNTTIDNSLITNRSEQCLERLAAFINIPAVALQPYKNECIVRQYNKGQVIYYSSDELTHVYYLIDGYILREHFNMNGDVYRLLNKDDQLFPMHNLFQDKTTNEMCTAITDCIMIAIPIELIEYLCRNNDKVFIRIYQLLCDNQRQQIEYHMALSSKSAKARVTKLLIYLCHMIGYDNDEFYEIKSFLTIQMISDLASISRETTGHIIQELKEHNILLKHHKNWIISKQISEL
ncbi:Crp/Fnr family transcriptional regulator [Staphylococcus pasteuri]|uniref:HTH-type transcriptional regulator ArcR n=2 Tax=Staphylococcus TaxID=1279 RepID=A0ABY1H6F5_9STAP|nr:MULTISPECIES: Crp/Fnr family transcriptional regulator [Staphylococcus]RQX28304.1 Crp/Fnr family transcriptional regulator [Staphylococcus warneri]ATH61593.1 Crp/Fnr family transcriptional regulator [Staphylococcus pasteuri]KKI55639.1 Transcriptional regulator ArcR [Staphylococcus pasteuri]MCD9067538.1 Crp/Fnr family transcriptional regulator [Staphylococcus pasteuri]MCF7599740.1 Crp/Fnr family transcriptional regulator [Staphylococcus pasteuri]